MPSARHPVRPRLMMAGAFVGAMLALSLSWTFSLGAPQETLSPREQARQEAFHASPGECVTWTQQGAADAHIVPCAEPHRFEVTSVADISAQYPPRAKPPDLQGWRTLTDEVCGSDIENYLGEPLDPHGRYSLTVLRPSTSEWQAGTRKVRCGLQRTGPGGGILTTTGAAAEQPQSDVFPAGTCLGLVGKSVGDPVDCAKPHAQEIIATVDLTEEFKFTDGFPAVEDQKSWLDKKCNTALKSYTDGADIGEQGLLLGWGVVKEESWQAASTTVNCKVGKPLEDGSGLASISGSIRKPKEASTSTAPTNTSEGG